MRRALTLALSSLMVSAALVAPAQSASADTRICNSRKPAAPVAVALRISISGSNWCVGSGNAKVTTLCQLQKQQGISHLRRWVEVPPNPPLVRSWVWQQACRMTAPLESGRFRARVRVDLKGPDVVKTGGWNQSDAVTFEVPR